MEYKDKYKPTNYLVGAINVRIHILCILPVEALNYLKSADQMSEQPVIIGFQFN